LSDLVIFLEWSKANYSWAAALDKATQAGRVPEWIERTDAPRLFSKEGEGSSKSVGTVQGGVSAPNSNLTKASGGIV
jgi:hypothetical protein